MSYAFNDQFCSEFLADFCTVHGSQQKSSGCQSDVSWTTGQHMLASSLSETAPEIKAAVEWIGILISPRNIITSLEPLRKHLRMVGQRIGLCLEL